ncbi:hypothetical protein D1007_41033 [Hordeum vulgare]|nr:hypothetical protein D1007_41033 [Hordeum vulgare]
MDARAWHPASTPLYSRDPYPPPAAAENPSAGSGGLATAGAPPSTALACSLFLPPWMTTATGGVAPAPSRAAAAPSKLPNAVRPKKGKTSAKKNKAADGSGSSKARGKKLAGRLTGAAATEAPKSSLVEPAADAHHVFDEMPQVSTMMHTCQLWVLAPTIRIGLKPMTSISKTMSSRWTRRVRALSTRRKEERP